MSQFLRPDSNVTQSDFTNGFANIDESAASDADFAYGANNAAAVLEVGLSNPSGTPAAGTRTVRYRVAKTNAGTVDGAGNAVTVTAELYQGTSLIAADSARTATGTWTGYSFTPDTSSVTDWNDLRLRFTTSASGGSPANRRGGAVSWAELETPDPPSGSPGNASGALGATVTASALAGTATGKAAGAGTLSQVAVTALVGSATGAGDATGALSGVTVTPMAGTATGGSGSVPGNAGGALVAVTVSALEGSASGRAAAAGAFSTVTASAMAGAATGRASTGGDLADVTLTAMSGSASGGAGGVPGDASGALSGITVSAMEGVANGRASAVGGFDIVSLFPMAATASGKGSAAGTFASVIATAMGGTAAAVDDSAPVPPGRTTHAARKLGASSARNAGTGGASDFIRTTSTSKRAS